MQLDCLLLTVSIELQLFRQMQPLGQRRRRTPKMPKCRQSQPPQGESSQLLRRRQLETRAGPVHLVHRQTRVRAGWVRPRGGSMRRWGWPADWRGSGRSVEGGGAPEGRGPVDPAGRHRKAAPSMRGQRHTGTV